MLVDPEAPAAAVEPGSACGRYAIYLALVEPIVPLSHWRHGGDIDVSGGAGDWIVFIALYLGPALLALGLGIAARRRNPLDHAAFAGVALAIMIPLLLGVFRFPGIDTLDHNGYAKSYWAGVDQEQYTRAYTKSPGHHMAVALRELSQQRHTTPRDPALILDALHSLSAQDQATLSSIPVGDGPPIPEATLADWERAYWMAAHGMDTVFVPRGYDAHGNPQY